MQKLYENLKNFFRKTIVKIYFGRKKLDQKNAETVSRLTTNIPAEKRTPPRIGHRRANAFRLGGNSERREETTKNDNRQQRCLCVEFGVGKQRISKSWGNSG